MNKFSHRDAMLVPMGPEEILVMACDSCGAIGMKEHDTVKVAPFISGKYTARVGLMEVLSLGAEIKGITINICNELEPTGQEILNGVRNELEECSIEAGIIFSTEKNMATAMTALGVTVVGIIDKERLLISRPRPGDLIYVVGKPKVGKEVVEDQGEIANTKVLRDILKVDSIQEIIPVGSSGVKGEIDRFTQANGFRVDYSKELPLDIHKSGGPCTVIIVISSCELSIEEAKYLGRLRGR